MAVFFDLKSRCREMKTAIFFLLCIIHGNAILLSVLKHLFLQSTILQSMRNFNRLPNYKNILSISYFLHPIAGIFFLLMSCTKHTKEQPVYESALIDGGIALEKAESISFSYHDTVTVGRIRRVVPWKEYLLVEDALRTKIWVFDKRLNYITTIGKKGRGPGEFSSSCIPTPKGDTLVILDDNTRKISLYDAGFHYLSSRVLPNNFQPEPTQVCSFGSHYLVSAVNLGKEKEKEIEINSAYIRNNKSVFVFDETMNIQKEFFSWDALYENENHSSFNTMASAVQFALGTNNTLYAHQIGDYKIAHFDTTYTLLKYFGRKSPYAFSPPLNTDIEKGSNSSQARGMVLFTQSTLYTSTQFDSTSNVVLSYFKTDTEESFQTRDDMLAKHYLQIYDATTYDCLFDGRAPGILLYAEQGKAYFLTEDSPKQFTITAYKITRK
jgi:hypothetical protein